MNKICIILILMILLVITGCSTPKTITEKTYINKIGKTQTIATPTFEYNSTFVRDYEIVEVEDISMKAMDKPLSAYSAAELEKLPSNIRKRYRVIVPSDVSKKEFKSTIIQVIMDETKKNSDIDEIVVLVYDRKEDADSIYTFGKVEWCPNGDWAGVTSKIASTNDRSSYQYVFDIKDKVGNMDTVDKPTEKEFEIFNYYDNKLLEETEKFYDAQDAGLTYKYSDENELEENVAKEVAKKYDISVEELNKIYIKVVAYKLG